MAWLWQQREHRGLRGAGQNVAGERDLTLPVDAVYGRRAARRVHGYEFVETDTAFASTMATVRRARPFFHWCEKLPRARGRGRRTGQRRRALKVDATWPDTSDV